MGVRGGLFVQELCSAELAGRRQPILSASRAAGFRAVHPLTVDPGGVLQAPKCSVHVRPALVGCLGDAPPVKWSVGAEKRLEHLHEGRGHAERPAHGGSLAAPNCSCKDPSTTDAGSHPIVMITIGVLPFVDARVVTVLREHRQDTERTVKKLGVTINDHCMFAGSPDGTTTSLRRPGLAAVPPLRQC
jgi:hypothetical protein